MKSKSLIEKQLQRKNNPELVETLIAAKKNEKWLEIASILSGSRRNRINMNLNDIEKEAEGDKVLVPGKVLSEGELSKKVKVIALNFSKKTKEKLKTSGIQFSSVLEEIKSNPSAEGIKVLGK